MKPITHSEKTVTTAHVGPVRHHYGVRLPIGNDQRLQSQTGNHSPLKCPGLSRLTLILLVQQPCKEGVQLRHPRLCSPVPEPGGQLAVGALPALPAVPIPPVLPHRTTADGTGFRCCERVLINLWNTQ